MFTMRVAIVMRQNEFDAKVAQEQFSRANRAGLTAVCDWYVKEVIPRHFKGNNRWVYKHSPRKWAYRKRKQTVTGQDTDLVYTGTLRREAMSSTYSVNNERGRVNVRGRVLNIGRPRHSQVDMRAEIMHITARELQEVETKFTEAFKAAWEGPRVRSKSGRGSTRTGRAAKPTSYH